MKETTWFVILALSMLFIGCTRMQVSSRSDPVYPFSEIRTYQWIDAPSEFRTKDEAWFDLEMQQALNNELSAQGWRQVLDATNATVQVAYSIIIRSHAEYTKTAPDHDREFSGGLVFNRSDREWNYEERSPEQIEYLIETGTFHFLMHDAASGKRVWHGRVEAEIDRSIAPEKRKERYREIARRLFRELP